MKKVDNCRGLLNLAQPSVTLTKTLTQTLVARLLISEVTKIWVNIFRDR